MGFSLQDFEDITPIAKTVSEDTPDGTWNMVVAGPDSQDDDSTQVLNTLPGLLRVGSTVNYILLNPAEPLIKLDEDGTDRLIIGKLDTDVYGVQINNAAGTAIVQIDTNQAKLSGWDLTQYTLTAASGVVGLNSEVTGGTDWRFWAGDVVPGDAPFRVDEDGNLFATAATISGTIVAGEIHIPDEDTTANSFHTDSDGNSWWGCTQTDFTSDPDNATAYVLKTGVAKFQNITTDGIVNIGYTNSDVFIINYDNDDIDVEFRFGRTTGGTASLTWNGSLVQCSKSFLPTELGINNISAAEPVAPFAKQIWLDIS